MEIQRIEKMFYDAKDISGLLNVSKSSAYRIIKQLNTELDDKGYITIRGKVNKQYFERKLYYVES